jgi:PQQ system protein
MRLLPAGPAVTIRAAVIVAALAGTVSGCSYLRMLRPSVLEQLHPAMAELVNFLPQVDDPNDATLGRIFAMGGLSHATRGRDGVYRDRIRIPYNEFIFRPSIVVMEGAGDLELDIYNEDKTFHLPFFPSHSQSRVLQLPDSTAGRIRIRLDQPGMYVFADAVGDHAGRGMLGLIIVRGQVPPAARLDRPQLPRPK